uniref:hypothetical protein n=1 Tax=Algoriphagus sp. TaxID=1872435 RepID=UPI004047CCFD
MIQGIYEELVTQLVAQNLGRLDKQLFYIHTSVLDKEEAAAVLAKHLSQTIKTALNYVKGENQLEQQLAIANKIILVLKEELNREEFVADLIAIEGEYLHKQTNNIP